MNESRFKPPDVIGEPRVRTDALGDRFERALANYFDDSWRVASLRESALKLDDEIAEVEAAIKLREADVVGSDAVQNPPAEEGQRVANNEQTRAARAQRILAGDPAYLGNHQRLLELRLRRRTLEVEVEVARDARSAHRREMEYVTVSIANPEEPIVSVKLSSLLRDGEQL